MLDGLERSAAIKIDVGHTQRELGGGTAKAGAGERCDTGLFREALTQLETRPDASPGEPLSMRAKIGEQIERAPRSGHFDVGFPEDRCAVSSQRAQHPTTVGVQTFVDHLSL